MEDLDTFVRRICRDVGCYYHENENNYSLQKYDTYQRGYMGVFGWVNERKTTDRFLVSTYKYLANAMGISDADKEKPNAHYIPKGKDLEGKGTGLFYYVMKKSNGNDYRKAVRALRVVLKNR